MTPEMIMSISALMVAVFSSLEKFRHSACCWGLMELDRSTSYTDEKEENPKTET